MGGVLELLVTAVTCMLVMTNAVSGSGAPLNITKDRCKSRCGKVDIPFPFGIGPDCSLNKWFEVFCNTSTTPHRALLKQTHWEVLNITNFYSSVDQYSQFLSQKFQIKTPISFSDREDKESGKANYLNLTGTPFVLGSNTFVALSCGFLAKIDSSSANIHSQIGCESDCSSSSDHNKCNETLCDAVDYCEAPIRNDILDHFNISFENKSAMNGTKNESKFAFVVDYDYWYDYKNRSMPTSATIRKMNIPFLLQWYINYTDIKKIFGKRNMSRSASKDSFQFCGAADSGYPWHSQCYCKDGLQGNPYLVGGCSRDLNECEKHQVQCGLGGTCVNTFGGYHCSYKRKSILIGVGSALGALFLIFGTWGLYKLIQNGRDIKRKRKFFKRNGGLLLQQQISFVDGNVQKTKLFNSNELRKATDNFSKDRILGQGGQGTVYKGMLEDGKIVAIKKSKIVDEAQLSEFINEVVILSQINHRNVVQLLGCCLETEVPLLVYEFISNGTLSQYIHEQNEEFPFTWKMRLRVAVDVAGALSYLHSAASFPIYHRDIKSTNILLDEKYRAKVADFGTSRTISIEQTHLTTVVYGTFGYLDPEYFQSSQFTEKSDVYSFGVVLVELLTGQKAISPTRLEEDKNLATYFKMTIEAGNVFGIIDPQVLEDAAQDEIRLICNLAQRCLNLNGRNRPTMKEVAIVLEGIQRPERAASVVQQNHDEVEYVSFCWDVVSTSTGSTLD